ncbi:MAG: site-specific DNA-methyltransferase [Planctomycetales bacterium]|nr:site-specific DNA-methyltransferase [Planctomycetales bacterium]MCA9221774.1 site-specific DNA-methyltransferase [Planctomycetales bacterium]MCA9227004.1 site-specific DNA-methyltransferase [Planctomycetales bacterium]
MNVRTNGPEPTAIVPRNEIICADAETALGGMPAGCIDAVVTSPPYFQQRDYGADRQIGREPTPAEYIARLVRLFQQVRRVLAETGTVWIVIGDKYVDGQLLGLPWRVAIALQDDGWQLRNDVIWHKPNAMPSAAKRRLTTDHEYVFLFTKSAGYYFDGDSIREPHVTFSEKSRMRGGRGHFFQRGSTPEQGKNGGQANLHDGRWDQAFHPLGRNKRTVWSISLGKCREAHFAVFPEPLVETCIQAGSPPGGLVLDPFLGSGTTAIVARRLGRDFLGVDCQAEYCEMARKRLEQSG